MRLANNIRISVYCRDDCSAVKDALVSLVPFKLEQEKVSVQQTVMKGEHMGEQDITILEIVLNKERHIVQFLESLTEKLTDEQRQILLQQHLSRFDDDFNFFLRLDRAAYLEEKRLKITDSGDCFHIRISIAAYPKRYDTALAVLKQIFSGKV
ncbi:hypothetical protein HYV81_00630 [Candidatus Woesearchaeota archaeon]|nr:hypothetical protein [Candidatus Woesearchaeota archaeon]